MVGPSALVFGVLVPALVAGIVLLFLRRGSGPERPSREFLGALALGIGYLVAHVALGGKFVLPGGDQQLAVSDWFALFVAVAIVLAPLREVAGLARWSTPLYLALFSVLCFRFPLANQFPEGGTGLALRFALTLILFACWSASDRLAERLRGPALPAAWVVAGTGIALAALFNRSGFVAQLAGALTAGLGAAAVVGCIDRGTRFASGAVAIVWIGFTGVLGYAALYDLPHPSIALAVLALLAPWVVAGRALESRPFVRTLLAMFASALPVALAAWMAWRRTAA